MAEETNLEASRIGEETASKAVTPVIKTGDGGSNPSASADKPERKRPERQEERKRPVPVVLFKLNFRRPNGEIRSDIPRGLVNSLISGWSDLLRIIPANRWSSLEEIVQLVWEWEKRQYRLMYPPRTRPQIEKGITELVEAGVLNSKS